MTGGPRHMTGLPKNILSSYKYITSGTFYLEKKIKSKIHNIMQGEASWR
jgi:hypothetical protein